MPDVIILIASQFDLVTVVICYLRFTLRRLSVVIISTSLSKVESLQQMDIFPDASLSAHRDFVAPHKKQLILLPGSEASAAIIMSDPRAHHFVQHILHKGGCLAITKSAEFLAKETKLFKPDQSMQVMRQGTATLSTFIEQLSNHIGERL